MKHSKTFLIKHDFGIPKKTHFSLFTTKLCIRLTRLDLMFTQWTTSQISRPFKQKVFTFRTYSQNHTNCDFILKFGKMQCSGICVNRYKIIAVTNSKIHIEPKNVL